MDMHVTLIRAPVKYNFFFWGGEGGGINEVVKLTIFGEIFAILVVRSENRLKRLPMPKHMSNEMKDRHLIWQYFGKKKLTFRI